MNATRPELRGKKSRSSQQKSYVARRGEKGKCNEGEGGPKGQRARSQVALESVPVTQISDRPASSLEGHLWGESASMPAAPTFAC